MATDNERIVTLLRSNFSRDAISAILNVELATINAIVRQEPDAPELADGGGGLLADIRRDNPQNNQSAALVATFTQQIEDTNGFWDPATPERITFAEAGYYSVTFSSQASGATTPLRLSDARYGSDGTPKRAAFNHVTEITSQDPNNVPTRGVLSFGEHMDAGDYLVFTVDPEALAVLGFHRCVVSG